MNRAVCIRRDPAGLTHGQLAMCALTLAMGFFLNSGCAVQTFGTLTTTGTGSGDGGSGTTAVQRLERSSVTVTATSSQETRVALAFADNTQTGKRFVAFWDAAPAASQGPAGIFGRELLFSTDLVSSDVSTVRAAESLGSVRAADVDTQLPARDDMVVVWQEQRPVGATSNTVTEVRGVRVRRSGSRTVSSGSPFTVSQPSDPALNALAPAVAAASSPRHYLVAYPQEAGQTSGGFKMFARRLDSTGQPIGSAFSLSDSGSANLVDIRSPPDVAFGPTDNQMLAVWSDGDVGLTQIRAVFVSAATTTSAPEASFNVSLPAAEPANARVAPQVAFNSFRNEFLVVWRENGPSGFPKIVGRRVKARDNFPGGIFEITGEILGADLPAISYAPGIDRYLVVWQDSRSGNPDIRGREIGYDASGNIQRIGSSDFTVASGLNPQTGPRVAHDPQVGNWLVAWTDNSGGNENLIAQRVNSIP